ncbi:LysR family transcriptional regulator [Sulfitobacter sp. JBTF-M27]|uniref:LysR family transcriptional regulator n=1 Tax=Sulfitobacter sediminilitoris TaxID=2698830 RepID=A0A6P0C848_9RHOB|nr:MULTISPECIES: LysR family transcriptional regulator [Rhodobacterales]NEK22312.1 LysR family transcriptional regulator [Sulfitobacter sediminilitoris]
MQSEAWNWSDIRVFLMVVREGSTLAASRKLGLAQPTVARRIDALEHATGLVLFERDTRGFKLTKNGHDLIKSAETVEAAANSFARHAVELSEAKPIRITAYAANFSPRMVDIVNEFSTTNPGIAFEFLPSVRALDLIAGEADIALRLVRSAPDPNLISRKISDAKWSLFGGKTYEEQFGLPISSKDLEGHRFVTFQRGDVPNVFHDWLLERIEPEQIVATYSELDLMHAAIRAGHGLGISNVKLLEPDETLIRCFDEIEELSAPHLLLVSPDAYRRPEVRAFVKYFAPRYAAIYKE